MTKYNEIEKGLNKVKDELKKVDFKKIDNELHKVQNELKKVDFKKIDSFFFPVIIGAAFGFGWTPCIGPILGSILALASIEDTLSRAIILLSFYSLGLAIPFVLSGYLIQKFLIFSKNMRQYINIISKFVV